MIIYWCFHAFEDKLTSTLVLITLILSIEKAFCFDIFYKSKVMMIQPNKKENITGMLLGDVEKIVNFLLKNTFLILINHSLFLPSFL